MDPERVKAFTDRCEARAKKQLERAGFAVEKIPECSRKRPDFKLRHHGSDEVVALCEHKTIVSGGRSEDGVALSTLDERGFDEKIRCWPAIAPRVEEALAQAVAQFREYVEDKPELAGIPCIVALSFDEWADCSDWIDRHVVTSIAGLLYLVPNRARTVAMGRESRDRQRERVNTGDANGLPPETLEWRYVANPNALHPLPLVDAAAFPLHDWPEDPIEPGELEPDSYRAAWDEMQRLDPPRQWVLRRVHEAGGFLTFASRDSVQKFNPIAQQLVASGLLEHAGGYSYTLTERGRTLTAVDAAERGDQP